MLVGLTRLVLRCRWAVVVGWIALLLAGVHFLPPLSSVVQNDNATFLPASAPSVQAAKLITNLTSSGEQGGVLVAVTTGGPLTPRSGSPSRSSSSPVTRSG